MRTSSPVPPGRANAASWRSWLLPGSLLAFFVALLALPRGAAAGTPLTYTQFVTDVGAGTVLIYFVIRGARQQARGLGSLTSVTKAKARVIGAERPVTRFTDVAG